MAEEKKSTAEELEDLQKKYKFVSNDFKRYTEEIQTSIRKQRTLIDKLTKENKTMKDEIQTLSSAKDHKTQSRPTSALITPESYKQKIEHERKKQQEYERSKKILQEKILKQRSSMGGINASRENSSALDKQIRILENRLEKANQKFNESIANNKKLREEIDNLRRERVIFDNIYQKLEKELHDRRKEMADIIETANSAYEDRDRAQTMLAKLKQDAEREQIEFEKEWKELNTMIEKDVKMNKFMKMREDDVPEAEEDDMVNSKAKGNWGAVAAKTTGYVQNERIRLYEDAFSKIQAATGIHDIDELVESFIKAEEQNFSLFKYVNELSDELDALEIEIGDLQEMVESYKGKDVGATQKRRLQLKALEGKLAKFETKADNYDLKFQHLNKTLNALRAGIESLFNTIECDPTYAVEFLGTAITENNMMAYMGLIEQRASEILQSFQILQNQAGYDVPTGPAMGPSGGSAIKINAPPVRDDVSEGEEDDSEEDDKPLTSEELKMRIEKKIQQANNSTKNKSRGKAMGKTG